MFSTKTAAINNEEFSNSSYMPVGINQNITLKEVNCNKRSYLRMRMVRQLL